jgi:ribose transport system ATP-binding protein
VRSSERLVIENVHKQFGAVKALDGVSLTVRNGSVHGVIGHNGSGKSTLVKILSGVIAPDQGSFQVVAADSRHHDHPEHRRPRVATVFQDLGLADHLSVFENILVNNFRRNRLGFISDRSERARAKAAMSTLGFDVPLGLEAWRLPTAERVMVCVTRALFNGAIALQGGNLDVDAGAAGADVLLLDEPTSSLPREELEKFRNLIMRLKREVGITIVIVTHNPNDVSIMCDELTALKGGQVLCTVPTESVTSAMLAELMAGKAMAGEAGDGGGVARPTSTRPTAASPTDSMFAVVELLTEGLAAPVTVSADEGELLGVTGLEGSGFREFVAAAAGARDVASGQVYIAGRWVTGGVDALRRANGVYIPADRARTSGVPTASIYENMTLGIVDAYCRLGMIEARRERLEVTKMLKRLDVRPPDPRRTLAELSGGQQQKVVVGRALLAQAKVIVFEEPAAAVDVGAREDILRYLQELTRQGRTLIVATAEFEWLPSVCDRIVVFRSGQVAGELLPDAMQEETILRLMYGN